LCNYLYFSKVKKYLNEEEGGERGERGKYGLQL